MRQAERAERTADARPAFPAGSSRMILIRSMNPFGQEDAFGPQEDRLVAHFRSAQPLDFDAGHSESDAPPGFWKAAVLSSIQDLDGQTSGWGDDFIAVDFPSSRVVQVTRLLSSGALAPDLSVGLASGPIFRLRASGMSLGEGEGLRRARLLSEAALPGEVLVSDELAREARLRAFSEAPRRALREELRAVSLDLESPLLDVTREPEGALEASDGPSDGPMSVSSEALRRYRAEKVASKKEGGRGTCRASLALAVALAQVGRDNEAILEALEGLSWARETNDARGERACALFLAQFAERRSEETLALSWAEVARSRAGS